MFIGYPSPHKGYWCLDISTQRVIISRHIVFNELVFPFAAAPSGASSLDFLIQDASSTVSVAPPTGVELPSSSLIAPSSSKDEQSLLHDPAIIMISPVQLATPSVSTVAHVGQHCRPAPQADPAPPIAPGRSSRFGAVYQHRSPPHPANRRFTGKVYQRRPSSSSLLATDGAGPSTVLSVLPSACLHFPSWSMHLYPLVGSPLGCCSRLRHLHNLCRAQRRCLHPSRGH
jgi:hypothetical protein